MWKISDTTTQLLQRLYNLHASRTQARHRECNVEIVAILEQIADQNEPGAISAVARCLFHNSDEVRIAANLGVQRLLSSLPPEQLLHLSEAIGWSWGWYISDAWEKLTPSNVDSLISDLSARTSVLGVVSFHHNGYARHEAVRLLSKVHDGSELPYLLIRQNDWVEPISADAQTAIEERLFEDYLPHFITSFPLVVHLLKYSRYDHSNVVRQVIKMLVQPQHDVMLADSIRSPNRAVRRRVVKIALDIEGEHQKRVVEQGLISEDATLRLWCARRISSYFSGEELLTVLQMLMQDRFMPVRREALLVEAECFPVSAQGVWKKALLDENVSIRELARTCITKYGEFDTANFYRQTLAKNSDSLEALNGLGETGAETDLTLFRKYLKAPLPSRQRAAVRGLAKTGGKSAISDLVVCLRNDNPGVVREAQKQLLNWLHEIDGEQLLSIVANDSRQHVRSSVIRLIFELGKWRSLPWLIRLATYEDRLTAKLSQEFIDEWFSPPRSNRIFTRPSKSERQVIDEALLESRESLNDSFRDKLEGWLAEL